LACHKGVSGCSQHTGSNLHQQTPALRQWNSMSSMKTPRKKTALVANPLKSLEEEECMEGSQGSGLRVDEKWWLHTASQPHQLVIHQFAMVIHRFEVRHRRGATASWVGVLMIEDLSSGAINGRLTRLPNWRPEGQFYFWEFCVRAALYVEIVL